MLQSLILIIKIQTIIKWSLFQVPHIETTDSCSLYVPGGAAEQVGLQQGDVVLQVQGISLQDKTRFEAWNLIKMQPDGTLELLIRRMQQGALNDAEDGSQTRGDGE